MKQLILLFILLVCSTCAHAQFQAPKNYPTTVPNLNMPDNEARKEYNRQTWKTVGTITVATLLGVTSGVAQGMNETIQHDYPSFKANHPNASERFWNPQQSWRNKWKNGDPNQGAAFFGSTTIFVPFTDGYHTTNTIDRSAIIGGTLVFGIGSRDFLPGWKNWQRWLAGFAYMSIVKTTAFNITYHWYYGRPF